LLRSVSQLMLANNTFVPLSTALYFNLEPIIAPRQSFCNNIFAFWLISEGRKKDDLAYLEFVVRHCTSARRNSTMQSYHFWVGRRTDDGPRNRHLLFGAWLIALRMRFLFTA
jgi:hypothetical protein